MLTLEEFFRKKKIDLAQLQVNEPALFADFEYDYSQMGEKSFDHSKKFWFNRLRKVYHLKEEPKPAKPPAEKNELASQAASLESPTIEQTRTSTEAPKPTFKPRFKPGMVKMPATDSTQNDAGTTEAGKAELPADERKTNAEVTPAASAPKPIGFKPRFKASPKSEPRDETLPPTEIDHNASQQATPLVANALEQKSADEITPEAEQPKPAYKPKFNMKNIKAVAENSSEDAKSKLEATEQTEAPASKDITTSEPDKSKEESKPAENITPPDAASQPKPAYKPRFNAKNIKPKSEDN